MRLFIGLRPAGGFPTALADWQERLRSAGVTGRYAAPSSLHMTLAFIGEWHTPDAVPLPEVPVPFSLALGRPGVFAEAKVLWAGVEPSDALSRLADSVRRQLDEAGIPFDRKPFYPHITLARKPQLPEGLDLSALPVQAARMMVDTVCLYRSDRLESGMQYTVIRSTREEKR